MAHVLTGLDGIRLRPGMYIGDVHDGSGLAHMIWELVANALDEHLAGRCRTIGVALLADGGAVVQDDGRGIAVHDVDGVPFAQRALTSFHTTPTLDAHAPHEHVGHTGVGLMPVNALSSWLRLDTFHGGRHYAQRYERGAPVTALEDLEPTGRSGTRIAFLPDPTIFSNTWLDSGVIAARLRELACVLPGLTLSFADRREHRFHEPRGLMGLLEDRSAGYAADVPRLHVRAVHGAIDVEVVAEWWPHASTRIDSFANVERTTGGGTHVRGLCDGLADGLRIAAGDRLRDVKRSALRAAATRGMHAVACVRLRDATYDQPTRNRLDTPEAADAVRAVVRPAFEEFLGQEAGILERLVGSVGRARR